MNISFVAGGILAWGMVFFGIFMGGEGGFGNVAYFIDPVSLAIVVGGTIGCLVSAFPLDTLKNIPTFLKIAMFPPKFEPREYISQIEAFALTARSKGLLAIEDGASKCEDPFMKQALMLIVDATDPDKARAMLEDSIAFTDERHSTGFTFCDKGMALSPAFGMIGTLVGLVLMLVTLADGDSDLGGSMAVALITTFYGSLLANVVFAPWGSALRNAHSKEILCKQLIVEGVMSIAAGSNPRLIKEKLEFMLSKTELSKGGAPTTKPTE